jgi:hypothetical protein
VNGVLRRLIAWLLALVIGSVVPGAAVVAAAACIYDAQPAARSDVHQFTAAGAGQSQLRDALASSTSPAVEGRRASTTPNPARNATNTVDDFVDLTTPGARTHILDGEIRPNGTYSGGHRPGTGFPGKSEFPSGWSDGRILHEISDVATDPAATRIVQGSRTVVTGSRGGVDIRVVIDNTTGEIVTGYPTNMPINP